MTAVRRGVRTGATYATAGDDGFVRIWDWRSGHVINERHVAATPIARLDYTGDGRRLVVAERYGTTYAIDAETLEPDGGAPIEIDHEISKLYAQPGQPHRHRPRRRPVLGCRRRHRPSAQRG